MNVSSNNIDLSHSITPKGGVKLNTAGGLFDTTPGNKGSCAAVSVSSRKQ